MESNGRGAWLTPVGGGQCRVCGLEGNVVATPNRAARLAGWLRSGRGPSATLRCANGHEWPAGSAASLVATSSKGASWLGRPARLVRVVLRHRTAEPSPAFWVGAALIGLIGGVVVQLTIHWPWLPVMIGWLLLLWLMFLATALLSPGRDGLWTDLVRVVSPNRANTLETTRLLRLIGEAPTPVYGLTNWEGERSLGGYGRSGTALTHLELIFGNSTAGPHIRIETMWMTVDRPSSHPTEVRGELTRDLWRRQASPPEGLTPQELHQWATRHRAELAARPIPDWADWDAPIDGTLHPAGILAVGGRWVGLIELEHAVIGLRADGIPMDGLSLAQVDDISPFAGRR